MGFIQKSVKEMELIDKKKVLKEKIKGKKTFTRAELDELTVLLAREKGLIE